MECTEEHDWRTLDNGRLVPYANWQILSPRCKVHSSVCHRHHKRRGEYTTRIINDLLVKCNRLKIIQMRHGHVTIICINNKNLYLIHSSIGINGNIYKGYVKFPHFGEVNTGMPQVNWSWPFACFKFLNCYVEWTLKKIFLNSNTYIIKLSKLNSKLQE